ncbi:MAG: hypothetical protein ACJ72M_03420 [Propionibacteriaceae bacterium]
MEAGKTALVAGRSGPSSREEQLEAEVVELTQALGEAHVELRVWKKSAEGRLGPFEGLEVIRTEAGTSTAGVLPAARHPERTSPKSCDDPTPSWLILLGGIRSAGTGQITEV